MNHLKDTSIAIIGTSLFSKAIAAEFASHGATVGLVLTPVANPPYSSMSKSWTIVKPLHSCAQPIGPGYPKPPAWSLRWLGKNCWPRAAGWHPICTKGSCWLSFLDTSWWSLHPQLLADAGKSSVLVCELTSSPVVCDALGDAPPHPQAQEQAQDRRNRMPLQDCRPELPEGLPPYARSGENAVEPVWRTSTHPPPLPVLMNLATVEHAPQRFRHFIRWGR